MTIEGGEATFISSVIDGNSAEEVSDGVHFSLDSVVRSIAD